MRTIETLRPLLSSVAASAGIASGVVLIAGDADAQDLGRASQPSDQPAQGATSATTSRQVLAQAGGQSLPPINVEAPAARSRPASATSGREQRAAASRRSSRARPTVATAPNASPSSDQSASAAPSNTLQMGTGIAQLPGPIQSIPQTITVIPQVVIQQQQATTINQVLQYVPGITVATGEGNGGITGDQFRIRGFDASGDIYVDGLRDFGSYIRDSFATENILVLKGPSSQSFGNGTTGGVIEIQTKKAHLGNSNSIELTGGMGPYGRTVVDVNRQLDATTAMRIVTMGNAQDAVDRDNVYSNRWGVLGSVGFGLGTDQSVIMNYFHQHSTNRPDFGVPMARFGGAAIGEPLTENGVPRSNYHGRPSDRDTMDADVATILYKGEFGDALTLTSNSRFGYYQRDVKFTPILCMDVGFPTTVFYGIPASTCATDVAAGNLNTGFTRWPVGGTKQTSYGGENVTSATMRFHTGVLRHELIAGIDIYAQHATMNFYNPSGVGPSGTLLEPIFQNPLDFAIIMSPTGSTARSWNVGPFISDRIWFTPEISVLGGVRWDHYNAQGVSSGTPVDTTTEFASPKASFIWEPTKQQTYYLSYAQSFTPAGNNITSLSSSLSLTAVAGRPSLKPQVNTTYELGGKWSFLDGRLGATAALFRVDKDNTSYVDPASGIQTTTDDKVRVQGVELGLTGKITDLWTVQASYAYMDSEILSSSISLFNPVSTDGNRVPYVSEHGASLWTSYDIVPLLQGVSGGQRLPGQMLIGGGVNYRSEYYVNNANLLRIPAATTLDAMLSYDFDRYHLAVNVTNLTNTLTYSSAFGNGYATPVAGRTVVGTVAMKF